MYNLFISHSWAYSNEYNSLISLLDSDLRFQYRNYSVPKDSPIHNAPTDWQLRAAIREQMSHASCVLILAGVYATRSKWINIEIDLAKNGFSAPKKIIAVVPRGQQRISTVVQNAADEIVYWNTSSIVNAIQRWAK